MRLEFLCAIAVGTIRVDNGFLMVGDLSTMALVAAARAQNRVATERLFQSYYPRVLKVVEVRLGRRLRQVHDPADIAQSVFGRALRALPRFEDRGQGSFAAWLGEIVECTIRDKARWLDAGKRAGIRHTRTSALGDRAASSSAGPSRVAEKAEDVERLHRAMRALTERERKVIELRMFLGLRGSEVSKALGVTDEAARKIYARALERVGSHLLPHDGRAS